MRYERTAHGEAVGDREGRGTMHAGDGQEKSRYICREKETDTGKCC